MNTRLKIILIIYLICLTIGFILPFVLFCEDQLKWSLEIIRTISIFSASILALFYFDPFGIRKSNTVKQHDNVIDILECIAGQRLLIESKSDNPKVKYSLSFLQHYITVKELTEFHKSGTIKNREMSHIDFPVLINVSNFIDGNEKLIRLKNSIYTPKNIVEKMAFFEFRSASLSMETYTTFSKISWGSKPENDNLCDTLNGEKISMRKILSNYYDIVSECISWLEKNSFSTKKLNLK